MSPRIAVVGANGRLGAELCLRLDAAGHALAPIARNRAGSAFLRLAGLECRHGRVSVPAEARPLLEDCDVVVHLAYAVPRSRDGHRANLALARHVVEAAPAGAAVVLASTIMVYGPTAPVRLPDAYGLEKLQIERLVRRAARQRGSRAYVFRIGHTLGELQPLTLQVQDDIREDRLALPGGGERASNTVFVAGLAEAVAAVAEGRVAPQPYHDLVTSPQWSWREVYGFYGGQPRTAPVDPVPSRVAQRAIALALRPGLRERLLFGAQLVPAGVADRAYGLYLQSAARGSLGGGAPAVPENGGVGWRALTVRRPFPGLSDPPEAATRYALPERALGLLGEQPVFDARF